MTSVRKPEWISVEDYLAGEALAEVRHEYVAGQVYAMVGSTLRHNSIAGSLFARIKAHLAGSGCRAFMSDVKVRCEHAFYYPDVVVTCAPVDPAAVYLTEPQLIIEVLSESTERHDRLEKGPAYRALPSLREYALVAQDRPALELYRRREGDWDCLIFEDADTVELASVKLSFPLPDLYADLPGG